MTDKNISIDIELPSDSCEFIKNVERNIIAVNPYLSHNRFFLYKKKEVPNKMPIESRESLLFKELSNAPVNGDKFCRNELKKILDMVNERNKIIAESFPYKKSYGFKPFDKLILGMGGISPYSNILLMKLHHIYGVPYIPASTIKGTLRNCWIWEKFEGDEKQAENDPEFREIFGSAAEGMEKTEGKLICFDTFPMKFMLGLDVQTPHYKAYYEGKTEPTDDQKLYPLFFTCLYDAEFEINFAFTDKSFGEKCEEKIDHLVECMFTDYGIGAKTSLGYGMGEVQKQ